MSIVILFTNTFSEMKIAFETIIHCLDLLNPAKWEEGVGGKGQSKYEQKEYEERTATFHYSETQVTTTIISLALQRDTSHHNNNTPRATARHKSPQQ